MTNEDIIAFLKVHLQSILDNDTQTYNKTTSGDLTLYEWWMTPHVSLNKKETCGVTPHRIDGLPFHEFMMTSNAESGTVFGSEGKLKSPTRFDLSNLHIQNYGDTAIASYTLLLSSASPEGVKVVSHHESRVIVKLNGTWKVVHVHKSPAWKAPHIQP
jgi:hypothetical protein